MKHWWRFFVVLLVVALATLACEGSVSTAKIASAKMTTDKSGSQETTVYAQDQPFYCIVELANAPEDTKVKAVWTAVEVEGEQPNLVIDQVETSAKEGNTFTFDLTNNGLWPKGKYKVDLYLDDKLTRTLEFEVR